MNTTKLSPELARALGRIADMGDKASQDPKAAAAARGVTLAEIPFDAHGNRWAAIIQRKGRGAQVPLARLLGDSADDVARAALRYLGVRGWV
jgi:polysaccharide deacetylase 2 family uncharacterized protein YibQ